MVQKRIPPTSREEVDQLGMEAVNGEPKSNPSIGKGNHFSISFVFFQMIWGVGDDDCGRRGLKKGKTAA